MNRLQKISLTLVITFSLGLLLEIIVIAIRIFRVGFPNIIFVIPVYVAGSGGIISLFFKKDKGAITSDERDKQIEKNAHLAGFGAVYLLVILVSIVPPMINSEAKIPTTWFPALLISAGFCQAYAQSIAILIQYGRNLKVEEK
jgi:hypothetical protein